MTERSTKALDTLAGPLYFLAILLIGTPLVDILANTWPLHVGLLTWRYGAAGMFSGFVLTPLLGLGLACWLAITMGHRAIQRVLMIASLVAAVVLLVVALGFVLDVLQLRHNVPANPPQALWTFEVGAAKAFLKHVTAVVALAWFGFATRRALRGSSGATRPAPAPLVVPVGEREH